MIRYLNHQEIDKPRWDRCIAQSVNRRVYAFSWYLDMVAPGWEALVDDTYEKVFPLPARRKYGIGYLAQPFFTQQLGLFSADQITPSVVNQFLMAIPVHYRLIDINLNSLNRIDTETPGATLRRNHELDLIASYGNLYDKYAQNAKRNLRRAMEGDLLIDRKVAVGDLVKLFRDHFGRQEGKLGPVHYATIHNLLERCKKEQRGFVEGVRTAGGNLSAAAFFLTDGSRAYLLFAASSPEARENGAMFRLIDHFIREHAGQPLTLDFEGGNDPNLGRFYKGFGASEVTYPVIHINRLPWAIRSAVQWSQKLRKLR